MVTAIYSFDELLEINTIRKSWAQFLETHGYVASICRDNGETELCLTKTSQDDDTVLVTHAFNLMSYDDVK